MFVNLISCDECGIVYDREKLNFDWRENEDGSLDEDYVRYNQTRGDYQSFVNCRVCNSEIFKGSQ